MFESLQKLLLNKAMGQKADKKAKKGDKKAEKDKKNKDEDLRTYSGIALDEAIAKLESSGQKMDDLLASNEELLAQVKAEAAKKLTPERRALIESAQRVKNAKAKILKDLDDETLAKLYLTAMRAFTGRE